MTLVSCNHCGVYVDPVNGICPSCHRPATPRRSLELTTEYLDPFEVGPWSSTANVQDISRILRRMRVRGADGMTCKEIGQELNQGARFVVYEVCISGLFMTWKTGTKVYFLRTGDSGVVRGLQFSLFSFLFGWWGIPWGPIYTILSIYHNSLGGLDVTDQILFDLRSSGARIPL